MKNILVGAVAYAPQIVPIWDTIRDYANDYFKGKLRLDYVLFSNYERQVEWLLNGKSILLGILMLLMCVLNLPLIIK